MRWEKFRQQRIKVISEYCRAKKLSQRGQKLAKKILAYNIYKRVSRKFKEALEKRMRANRFQWATLKVVWTIKRKIKKNTSGFNVEQRNCTRLTQSLTSIGTLLYDAENYKAVHNSIVPFLHELHWRYVLRRRMFILRKKIDDIKLKIISNVCVK